MKRLLCIVSSMNTGGAETFLMKIYWRIDSTHYQMDFAVNAPGVYDREITRHGGKVFMLPLRTTHPLASFRAMEQLVKHEEYHYVLKLCSTPIGVIDLLAAKCGGAERIGVRSCNANSAASKLRKRGESILRPILNQIADYKLAPSDLAAKFTFGERAFQNGEVILLRNGVDLSVYHYDASNRSSVRQEFGLADRTVIGHIGRFVEQKNHRFLLEVFCEIKKQRPDSVLLLIGEGPLENAVRGQADQLGLADSVIFTGIRSDIPQLLSAMDVFVFPSLYGCRIL